MKRRTSKLLVAAAALALIVGLAAHDAEAGHGFFHSSVGYYSHPRVYYYAPPVVGYYGPRACYAPPACYAPVGCYAPPVSYYIPRATCYAPRPVYYHHAYYYGGYYGGYYGHAREVEIEYKHGGVKIEIDD